MRMAIHTMLKDSWFNISIAQICASNMLESLYTAEKKIGAAVQKNVSALASCIGRRDKMWGLFHQTRTSSKFITT